MHLQAPSSRSPFVNIVLGRELGRVRPFVHGVVAEMADVGDGMTDRQMRHKARELIAMIQAQEEISKDEEDRLKRRRRETMALQSELLKLLIRYHREIEQGSEESEEDLETEPPGDEDEDPEPPEDGEEEEPGPPDSWDEAEEAEEEIREQKKKMIEEAKTQTTRRTQGWKQQPTPSSRSHGGK